MNNLTKKTKAIYRNYQVEKNSILNHPKMFEYLFNNPILPSDNLYRNYHSLPDETPAVYINHTQSEKIQLMFITGMKFMEELVYQYKLLKTNQLTVKVSNYLDKLGITHSIKWSFNHSSKYLNGAYAKPYQFKTDLKVDIFGCLFLKTKKEFTERMILFAVTFDENNYFLEYCLKQMNIHHLIIKSKNDVTHQVDSFIRKISKTKKHIAVNKPRITNRLQYSKEMTLFYQNYYYNHIVYKKYYEKNKNKNLEIPLEHSSHHQPDEESFIVSQELFNKLINDEYIIE